MEPQPVRDLVFREDDATVEGFADAEYLGTNRWRWAVGSKQCIRVMAPKGQYLLDYRIWIPQSTVTIKFFISGQEFTFSHIAEGGEYKAGYLLCEAPFFLETSVSGFNGDGVRFCDDPRALSFSIERLDLLPYGATITTRDRQESTEIFGSGASATFCAFPFVGFFSNAAGEIFPCNQSESMLSANEGAATKAKLDGSTNFATAWNSTAVMEIRRQMMSGVMPLSCAQCFLLESAGASSVRMIYNKEYLPLALEAARAMDSEGRIPQEPKVLDLQIGNRCNLKCRMCLPRYSSNLVDEYREIEGKSFEDPAKWGYWFGNNELIKYVVDQSSYILHLRVIGGEPMMTKEFYHLLKKLVDNGHSEKMQITFNTNGTILNKQVLSLFPSFRAVKAIISIDGYGEVNDRIRYPSRFSQIHQNMMHLHENMAQLGIAEVEFNTTVQIYNIFDIPNLLDYLRSSFPKFRWLPSLTPLTSPEPLSVLVLSDEDRERATVALAKYLMRLKSEWRPSEDSCIGLEQVEQEIGNMIHYLGGRGKTHLFPEFSRINAIFEKRPTISPMEE